MKLTNKNILLGISGSIAAYKSIELLRLLRKNGAKVRVVMTKSAKMFVTPLSLQILSGYSVNYKTTNPYKKSKIIHIELAKWADLILLAPVTANLLARLTVGMANDLLTTICLASTAPLIIVPAMNKQMYLSKSTQANLKILISRGILLWGPDKGIQSCGDIGFGKMLDPKILLNNIIRYFSLNKSLSHLNIMITAGPTREALDPVRFLTNYSSGKMGFNIARSAAEEGAKVTLISGPVHQTTPLNVNRINTTSALEMFKVVMKNIHKQHIFICCAAVTDYRVEHFSHKKIKKKDDNLVINLIKNPDIVATVGKLKNNRPYVVGFAAETHNIKTFAKEKLINKKMDLICANNISKRNHGFRSNRNALYLFSKDGKFDYLPNNNKLVLSKQLLKKIIYYYNEKNKR